MNKKKAQALALRRQAEKIWEGLNKEQKESFAKKWIFNTQDLYHRLKKESESKKGQPIKVYFR